MVSNPKRVCCSPQSRGKYMYPTSLWIWILHRDKPAQGFTYYGKAKIMEKNRVCSIFVLMIMYSWSLSMELRIGLLHTPKFFFIRFVLLEPVTSKIDKFPTIPTCNFRTAPSTLRVVQDCLVVCHLGSSYDGHLNIWLVKDYNGNEAWTRSCCINKA